MTTEELREAVARKLAANPMIKTAMMAEALGVPEADVMRVMPDGMTTELDAATANVLIPALEELGTIYFVVRNEACVSESKGRFSGFSRSGPFLNVSGPGLHLHLRTERIESIFAVRAQGEPGTPPMLSFQFFQKGGVAAFKVFLIESMKREAGESFAEACEVFDKLAKAHARGPIGD